MSATTLASSILLMAEADNFMKIAAAKQAMGKPQTSFQNQNDLQNTSIFSLKNPGAFRE